MRNVFFFLFASCAGLTGCSNAQSPQETFANQYCALFQPCCAGDAGAVAGEGTCRAWVTSQSFNEAATAGCLAAMRDAGATPSFCAMVGSVGTACVAVFEPTPSGTVPPGGTCSSNSDCAGTGDQILECTHQSASDGGVAASGTCLQISRGAVGEAPCFTQLAGGATDTSWPLATPYPVRSYYCSDADGLYCDFPSQTCRTYGQPGDACDFVNQTSCGPFGSCGGPVSAAGEGVCSAPLDAGASCQVGFPCGPNEYCSSTTTTCSLSVATGGACTSDEQCEGYCKDGACVTPAQATLCGP